MLHRQQIGGVTAYRKLMRSMLFVKHTFQSIFILKEIFYIKSINNLCENQLSVTQLWKPEVRTLKILCNQLNYDNLKLPDSKGVSHMYSHVIATVHH